MADFSKWPFFKIANSQNFFAKISQIGPWISRIDWCEGHSNISAPSVLLPLGFSNFPTALISVQSSRTLQFHGWNMILESSNISKYSIDFRVADMMIKWFLFVIVFYEHICILNTHWPDFWIYLRLISCQSKIIKPFFIKAPSLV